jgi:hypothetical protein
MERCQQRGSEVEQAALFCSQNSHKLSSIDELKKVKAEKWPDIVLWGNSTLCPQLLDANLIDRFFLLLLASSGVDRGAVITSFATRVLQQGGRQHDAERQLGKGAFLFFPIRPCENVLPWRSGLGGAVGNCDLGSALLASRTRNQNHLRRRLMDAFGSAVRTGERMRIESHVWARFSHRKILS